MKRIILSLSILMLIAVSAFAGEKHEGKAHWGYSGDTGPEHWGELSHDFIMCGTGKNQSPIDLTGMISARLKPLKVDYKASPLNVVNNGHTIKVNYSAGSTLEIDGKTFNLLQFHFHTPSENNINGKSYPMEAHLVHADKDGNLAVVAVMFEQGRANSVVEKIWEYMPAKAGEKVSKEDVLIDINDMLPRKKDYYRYNGSLTTPPCSEGVRWFVLKTAMFASTEQIKKFRETMGGPTNRPVQPVNARVILQ